MPDEIEAIRIAALTYLDGLHEGDADKLASVFHPACSLTYENEGSMVVMSRDDWLGMVRKRPSPKSRSLPRHDDILSIDQSSPTTALVKLKCAVPPRFYTDYLCFLKIGGRWQVGQKVFTTEIHN